MVTVNIRLPDSMHAKLKEYKQEQKPHMSLNALIVESVLKELDSNDDIAAGNTQIDTDAIKRMRERGVQ